MNRILYTDEELDVVMKRIKNTHHTGDLVMFSGVGLDAYLGKLASQTDYSRTAVLVIYPLDIYVLIMHVNHFRRADINNKKSGVQILKLRDILQDGYNYIDIFRVTPDARLSIDQITQYYNDNKDVQYDSWYYIHYLPSINVLNVSTHAMLMRLADNYHKKYCLEIPVDIWTAAGLFKQYGITIPGQPGRKKILYNNLLHLPFITHDITRLYPTDNDLSKSLESETSAAYMYFWWKL